MSVLGLFAAFATLFGAGYGVLALLVGRSLRLSFAERIAFSWLFGTGVVSLLLWIGGCFADGVLLQGFVTIVCFLLGMIGWKKMPVRLGLSVAGVADPGRPSFAHRTLRRESRAPSRGWASESSRSHRRSRGHRKC